MLNNGMEMMMKQIFRAIGLDPDKVMEHITSLKDTVEGIFASQLRQERRLAKIENHLGLADVEPVPSTMVIDNAKLSHDGSVASGSGQDGTR